MHVSPFSIFCPYYFYCYSYIFQRSLSNWNTIIYTLILSVTSSSTLKVSTCIIHERVIRFIHSDYNTEYFTLLKNLSLRTLYAKRLENICIEVYKIKYGLNPKYINELITERPSQHQYRKPLDLLIPKSNQITFGYKSFRTLAPIVWNTLPAEIQALTKLDEFQTKIAKIEFAWCSCITCCEKQKQVQQNL